VQVHRSKGIVRKVLSWLRSNPERAGNAATFADAWRLDEAGAPNSLERPAAEQRSRQEIRPAPEHRSLRPALRPAESSRPAQPRPVPASAPKQRTPEELRMIEELRAIQQLHRVRETQPFPQQQKPQPAPPQKPQAQTQPASRPAQPAPRPQVVAAPRTQPASPRPQPPRPRRYAAQEGTLAADGLVKAFGGRRVVNDVSIGLRRGEAVGLLGPNGAGKTTAFYMIVGLIKADAGRIMLDGHDVTSLPMYRRARLGIGYLPQEPSIFRGLSVEDNIRSVLEAVEPNRRKREEELDRLLDEFNIGHIRKSPAIALSGGERRRVEISRALATRPSFMLLDEPFAGIDPIAVGDIKDLVRHLTRRGIGVLITDHNVRETLGLVDRAYIVHSGSILMEGEPDEIVESQKVRQVYLGEEFRL
jgi:lipopolysaccharide export system ATP-binding protein